MADIYKVWIEIERTTNYGTEEEAHNNVSAFPLCSDPFKTEEEAEALVHVLEKVLVDYEDNIMNDKDERRHTQGAHSKK